MVLFLFDLTNQAVSFEVYIKFKEEEIMELLLAKKQDAEQVYELVQKTIRAVYPRYYLQEIVDMFCEFHSKENILNEIEAGNTYILFENGKIVGTGTQKENYITRVYVLPEYQRNGYGSFIMSRLEEKIKEGYDCAEIDASLPACKLYAKLGYQTEDHGIWECKNGVIQVYEIMKKQLKKKTADGMTLRPYKPEDAKTIVSWIKDERALRLWSSDRYGAYPVTANDMNYKYMECNGDCKEPDNFYPLTAVCEGEIVGHLILRYTDAAKKILRIGFVIVDDSKRGCGYGKRMIQMAIRYAFEMLQAEKVTLGVFENNPSAYYCYKAAGFEEIETDRKFVYVFSGEQWPCIEMEVDKI